ncbi:MAG: glycoside hydrolase family 97 protein, partial [Pseudomonadota bacterium]
TVAEAIAAADLEQTVFTEADRVASPNGDIVVLVSTDAFGRPHYEVAFRGETIVAPSRLGFRFKEQAPLGAGMTLIGIERFQTDRTWEQPWGERRVVRDRHNELVAEFSREADDVVFSIRFRVFDDGVGFRYEFPRQRGVRTLEIVDERTEFALPADATAWWIPARGVKRYEYLYRRTPLADVPVAHTPLTLRTASGVHLAVHEAALVDYAGMALTQGRPGVLSADLAPRADGLKVRRRAPFSTPWRTIQIAENAVGLANSDLILNLNEPNALGAVDWVKPGKYVGLWWAMHTDRKSWGLDGDHGATTDEAKRYIDFAAAHGFDGVLVEGWNKGWDGAWYGPARPEGEAFSFTESYPDFDLPAVAAYARERGVAFIGHHETSGDVSNYERQLDDAFDLYADVGVGVVKTGYATDGGEIRRVDDRGRPRFEHHDGQFMAAHHVRVAREAAKRQIAINVHEPIKDTGLRRTYPNMLTSQGARGQEYNAWGRPPNPPSHAATLAFTRMLAGPMDFAPGIVNLEPNLDASDADDPNAARRALDARVQTTLAKQLALYVVFYSPLQMAADLPENYEERPDALAFIKAVPVDWERSRALEGEIGDYVVYARQERGGDVWYLAGVTDETARQVDLSLSFLDADTPYTAEIYQDGKRADWKTNPYAMTVEERAVDADGTLRVRMAAGGGFAVRLAPANADAPTGEMSPTAGDPAATANVAAAD